MRKSLIYTKTGDKGKTGLIGGTRVPKDHYRLEAYGTVDELNSHIGLIRSYEVDDNTKSVIIRIQRQLFTIGSYLATDDKVSDLRTKLETDEKEIEFLEAEMDQLESTLPQLKNFVLPGGHPAAGHCHVCRTICRRAERRVISMSAQTTVDEWVIKYLNRLSDYFFVLSRFLSNYFNVDEIPWLSGLEE